MRIIIADCTATYKGRLSTYLPRAVRTILIKDDGTFIIHSDKGYKPHNWMSGPTIIIEEEDFWTIQNKKQTETLTLTIHDILSDTEYFLGEDPGLEKDGAEEHLQKLLAQQPDHIAPGLELVRREYPTPIGPVDILYKDTIRGGHVCVEVKRRGHIAGLSQSDRYLTFLNKDPLLAPVRGIYAAQIITPQAYVMAEEYGIECVILDYEKLKEHMDSDDDKFLF